MLKALGFNQLKVTSPFKVMVSDVNLHPYTAEAAVYLLPQGTLTDRLGFHPAVWRCRLASGVTLG